MLPSVAKTAFFNYAMYLNVNLRLNDFFLPLSSFLFAPYVAMASYRDTKHELLNFFNHPNEGSKF